MNRYIFSLVLFVCFFFTPFFASAETGWVIDSFASNVAVQESGYVLVEETISVDYFGVKKHGIYRDLPHTYVGDDGSKTYTSIDVLGVTRDGKNEKYQETVNRANVRIKIGDGDVVIGGEHTYVITYEVGGVLLDVNGNYELYWNAIGNEWGVPIHSVSANVSIPHEGVVQSACYTGFYGDTESCSLDVSDSSVVGYVSDRELSAGEGMTVAVEFKRGSIPFVVVDAPPTLWGALQDPVVYVVFFVVLIIGLIVVIRQWWKHGRDLWFKRKSLHDDGVEQVKPLRAYEAIGAEYDSPDDLRPAEIGVLMDEKADTLDVSATIVDLSVRGYMKIEELEEKWGKFGKADYRLVRSEKNAGDLMKYEESLLSALFEDGKSVKVSDLKQKFHTDLAEVKKLLYEEVTEKKLFDGNPDSIRKKHIGIALGVVIIGGGITGLGVVILNGSIFMSGVAFDIIGIVSFIVAFAMPRRTAYGREMFRKARGYELFVSGTEKYRQPFFEDKNMFMEVLPYAIVFGVTKKLSKAFQEMGIEPPAPTWYAGTALFNAALFANNINSFSSSMSSTMASTPSSGGSGGGGFSGGGFGGGGGGSW